MWAVHHKEGFICPESDCTTQINVTESNMTLPI